MKRLSVFILLIFPFATFGQHVLSTAANGDKYLAGVINIKIKGEYRSACSSGAIAIPELIDELGELGLIKLEKKFKTSTPPAVEFNKNGLKMADISLIYRVEVSNDVDVMLASKKLGALAYVEYAEPQYVSYDQYVPNDSHLNSVMPYHFNNVEAYAAWDITLGDTNVVIGITETAVNVNHPEFTGNIKYNYDDPVGGGDEDFDSYIDNFAGWDMVDDDNDLFVNNEIHGDAVSAIASASADNNLGYAGIGFKCKFLPVKVANNSQVITHGYEGIEYCVEQGCSIVNCSWGNTTFSQVAQDVVTWAAVNNDVVLVASAGNATSTIMYYPASYSYVLSVTGVDANDLFDNGTNAPFTYNDSVDVSAPGINVYTTATFNGSFLYSPPQGGTSMAAPIVSGIAGLVRSQFPCLSALEVIERIKASADAIDGLTQNVPYAGLIGTGRVNAEMAVSGNWCNPMNVAENNSELEVTIYPNPSTNEVNIRMNYASNWTVQVSDNLGRVVLVQSFKGLKLSVADLATGMYTVQITNDKQLVARKFSVIRH